jgi:hypothetical protein
LSGAAGRPALHWPQVEILPKGDAAKVSLPSESSGSHYYAARETDADVLRVPGLANKAEVEKFLFYRGVAGFQTPLTVKLLSADPHRVTITNTGDEELRSMFLYEVTPNGGRWLKTESFKPGETRTLKLDSAVVPGPMIDLAKSLTSALVSEGLYEREAAAMVKTWQSSWFGELGMRVLYTLPRAWTDRTLPLSINPAPDETQRVMVARAEIITPEVEEKLSSAVEHYITADPVVRLRIVAETRALGLGRFMQPALNHTLSSSQKGEEFAKSAWELFQAASVQAKAPVKVVTVE